MAKPYQKDGTTVLLNCEGAITPAAHAEADKAALRNRHARVFVPAGVPVRILAEVGGKVHEIVTALDPTRAVSYFVRVRGDAGVSEPPAPEPSLLPEDD